MRSQGYLGLIIISFVFLSLSAIAQDDNTGTHERWEYILVDTGDVLQFALPIAAGATTLIKKDYRGTRDFALSFATTMTITYSLKAITKRQRPEGRDAYDSFPSGHTSSAFSGASFIQRRYGWKYGKYAYLLAALVGVSRMEGPDGFHDLYDVLGGAAIAIGSTYLFTKPYSNSKLSVAFHAQQDVKLLTLRLQF